MSINADDGAKAIERCESSVLYSFQTGELTRDKYTLTIEHNGKQVYSGVIETD